MSFAAVPETRCAKVYKDMAQRRLQRRAPISGGAGRRAAAARPARWQRAPATDARSRRTAWKNAEVDALYRLGRRGRARAPTVWILQRRSDHGDGDRRGWRLRASAWARWSCRAEVARAYHQFLIGQIVRMLSSGLIHGDLSQFNVLVGSRTGHHRFAAGRGRGVQQQRLRDARARCRNITETLGRFAPELLETRFATKCGSSSSRRTEAGQRVDRHPYQG